MHETSQLIEHVGGIIVLLLVAAFGHGNKQTDKGSFYRFVGSGGCGNYFSSRLLRRRAY